jgi:hypothetical protein
MHAYVLDSLMFFVSARIIRALRWNPIDWTQIAMCDCGIVTLSYVLVELTIVAENFPENSMFWLFA